VRRLIPAALLLLALAVPPGAGAAPAADLWATVNACDSPRFPNRVGVRASMPGNGSSGRMLARFRLQYFSEGRGWLPVAGGRSPRVVLGSARRDRQGGYTFSVTPPAAGGFFHLRGVADLVWQRKSFRAKRVRIRRRGRTVVRRVRGFRRWVVARRSTQVTRAGVRGVRGGDGVSLASCIVR